MAAANGNIGDDGVRIGSRFHVALGIREAQNLVGIADVEVSRIGTRRIKRETERKIQLRCKDGHLAHLAVWAGSEDDYLALVLRSDEEIAIRRGDNRARGDRLA